MREEMARGRGVALQVLTHVVALFHAVFLHTHIFFLMFIKFSSSSSRPLSFFAVSYSFTVWLFFISHFFLQSLFNEQSIAHASVLSLMWSVQNETA